jgi:hypothetical protein
MVFKIIWNWISLPALALSLTARVAHAQVPIPPAIATPPPAQAPAPPPVAPVTASPTPPATAPAAAGPAVEMPPEQDMPAMELPRESAIENPLRRPAISGTAIGGYGELTLNAPEGQPAIVDLRRVVLYVGHNFNEHLRFYSELEVEHAVASSTDQGEFEVEQAYLDGLFGRRLNLRGGVIIMPVGIINVYHEPPTFNGVDRPEVDRLVIPSTWREPGIGIFGELAQGVEYQAYVVNGLNANGFTAESGVAEGHQEAQLAAARDFGGVARLTYEPRLATVFGLSGYLASSGNSLRSTVGNVPVGLIEVDARTRYHGFSARGELAFMFIGDTAALNQALLAADPAASVPVASQLRGGYLEAGYDLLRLLTPTEQTLTLFGRFDYANTQASVPAGFTADPSFIRYVYTVGLVYRPIAEIGLKLDYRRHELGGPAGKDGTVGTPENPKGNELAAAITWMF